MVLLEGTVRHSIYIYIILYLMIETCSLEFHGFIIIYQATNLVFYIISSPRSYSNQFGVA